MIDLLVIPVFLCILWKMDFSRRGFHTDSLSRENTTALKGILAVFVILHHLYQETEGGRLYFFFDNVGILCVSLFFFLSGYGLQKSYAAKPDYCSSLLRRRIPGVLVPYVLLILIYWLFSGVTGAFYSPADVLQSFIIGDPIATHSWYILCILVLYLGYYLSARLCGRNDPALILCNVLLCAAWVILCRSLRFGIYWYNAVIVFPMGIFWAVYEDRIVPVLQKHYLPALAAAPIGFCVFFIAALAVSARGGMVSLFWAACCCFVLLILLLMMKFSFRNPVLLFLGEHAFELYGIHGLFESLYRSPVLYFEDPALWSAAVLISTIPAAWVLHRLFRWVLRKLPG